MKYLIVIAVLGLFAPADSVQTDTVIISQMAIVQNDIDSIKIQLNEMIAKFKNDTL